MVTLAHIKSKLLTGYVNRALWRGNFLLCLNEVFRKTLRGNVRFLADYLEGGNRQIHELCVKEVSKVTIANDIVGNILGNDRPLIEQIIGETGGNLHLQTTYPDSPTTYQRL